MQILHKAMPQRCQHWCVLNSQLPKDDGQRCTGNVIFFSLRIFSKSLFCWPFLWPGLPVRIDAGIIRSHTLVTCRLRIFHIWGLYRSKKIGKHSNRPNQIIKSKEFRLTKLQKLSSYAEACSVEYFWFFFCHYHICNDTRI